MAQSRGPSSRKGTIDGTLKVPRSQRRGRRRSPPDDPAADQQLSGETTPSLTIAFAATTPKMEVEEKTTPRLVEGKTTETGSAAYGSISRKSPRPTAPLTTPLTTDIDQTIRPQGPAKSKIPGVVSEQNIPNADPNHSMSKLTGEVSVKGGRDTAEEGVRRHPFLFYSGNVDRPPRPRGSAPVHVSEVSAINLTPKIGTNSWRLAQIRLI